MRKVPCATSGRQRKHLNAEKENDENSTQMREKEAPARFKMCTPLHEKREKGGVHSSSRSSLSQLYRVSLEAGFRHMCAFQQQAPKGDEETRSAFDDVVFRGMKSKRRREKRLCLSKRGASAAPIPCPRTIPCHLESRKRNTKPPRHCVFA
jgi:hypothetical protein